MKRLKYTILILAAAAITSCKKSFLEQEPYGNSIQSGTFYNTVDEATGATLASYKYIDFDDWWQTQWWKQVGGEAASDNEWIGVNGGQGTAVQAAHYTLNPENDRIEAHWIEIYKSIYLFNATMEGLQNAKIDDGAKQKLIAELKFLRAFQYFELVRNWGAVPLITKTLSPQQNDYTRTSAADVYSFLKQDLNSAIAILPSKSQYSTTDKFRVSKGAAQALLAKIDLYTENWAEAQSVSAQIIASGDYTLENSYGNIWQTTNYNGKESIFEIQFQYSTQYPNLGNVFPTTSMPGTEGGWGYFTPTSDLENAFKAQGDSVRLNWTIIRHHFPVIGDPANTSFDANPSQCKSARYNRKVYIPRSERTPNGRFSKDHIYLRLADVYLMNAEAAAMQQQSQQALQSLKAVRDRVGLTTNMNLSGWDLINAVRTERRLELALEGDRLYDIRRWKDQSGQPVINSIMGPNGSFVKYNTQQSKDPYETTNLNEPQNKGTSFVAGKHNLWPIPSKEIIASQGRITQNPGY
ncbi:putative outer membrane starch-binding protein [Mucilaginibacter gracilis]|uniref:RagB/SusD domain-containing protein n=2 Tax=Mucilaginibacter TaxID=423349 RepID=H1YI94_9SPHI|nr:MULTISPECIES: RagB/SusD family nutrient uptake outer membrane protein [Mucilaginibacter]EHQ26529.1 RagB/SusD domain-containing protein [Mucilaginibacter paludis DSM 18603]RKR80467.1 putative outer membrane starch-binding protein [Mucilaginibacter gracilis]